MTTVEKLKPTSQPVEGGYLIGFVFEDEQAGLAVMQDIVELLGAALAARQQMHELNAQLADMMGHVPKAGT